MLYIILCCIVYYIVYYIILYILYGDINDFFTSIPEEPWVMPAVTGKEVHNEFNKLPFLLRDSEAKGGYSGMDQTPGMILLYYRLYVDYIL